MVDLSEGSIPPIDIALDLIRRKRNILLNDCDFYMMPDYPITSSKKTEWETYRQALRDITSTIDTNSLVMVFENEELDVGGFTWPTPPS